jgi:hypothetical protein
MFADSITLAYISLMSDFFNRLVGRHSKVTTYSSNTLNNSTTKPSAAPKSGNFIFGNYPLHFNLSLSSKKSNQQNINQKRAWHESIKSIFSSFFKKRTYLSTVPDSREVLTSSEQSKKNSNNYDQNKQEKIIEFLEKQGIAVDNRDLSSAITKYNNRTKEEIIKRLAENRYNRDEVEVNAVNQPKEKKKLVNSSVESNNPGSFADLPQDQNNSQGGEAVLQTGGLPKNFLPPS